MDVISEEESKSKLDYQGNQNENLNFPNSKPKPKADSDVKVRLRSEGNLRFKNGNLKAKFWGFTRWKVLSYSGGNLGYHLQQKVKNHCFIYFL